MQAPKALAALAIAALFPIASHAAVDVFLKLDGIKGESTDDRHKDEIVIESWSLGATNTGSHSSGGGGGAGKPCLSDLTLVKGVDKASPLLLQAAMVGSHIKEATLAVRKAGGKQQDYFIVTLKEVFVSKVQQSGGGDLPMESISLNFSQMKMTYKPQDADGAATGAVETTVSGRC
jgi:type VI secretion system secreted protein Hcp